MLLHASTVIGLQTSSNKNAFGSISAPLASIHHANSALPKTVFDGTRNVVQKANVLSSVDSERKIVSTVDTDDKSLSITPVAPLKDRELSASFTCESFSAYSVYSVCSDVVNYPFYMAAGDSFDVMEASVRTDLAMDAGSLWGMRSFVSSTCMSDYKKLKCAEVYKPCVDNGKVL